MPLALIIGIGAGLATAVLFASAWTGTALGVFVLFFLSPLPVAIAGLGWGWASAAVASAVGAALIGLVGTGRAALFHAVAIGAPTAIFSYLLLLSRQAAPPGYGQGIGNGSAATLVEWYPVGRVVAWASLWAGIMAALSLLSTATDVEGLRASLAQTLERMLFVRGPGEGGGAGRELTPAEKNAFVSLMVLMLPWAIASIWLLLAIINIWAAGHITRLSGRLMRPWPDLTELTLPPAAPLAFGAAILLTFVPGMAGLVASGFASALMFAFMLVGLALLHRVTRGMGARPAILGLVYGALLMLSPFSSLLVAMVGLAEPYFRSRQPPPGPAPPIT